MTTRNDITQDKIKSKANNHAYRDNHDRIFTQSYLKAISDICPRDVQQIPDYPTLLDLINPTDSSK